MPSASPDKTLSASRRTPACNLTGECVCGVEVEQVIALLPSVIAFVPSPKLSLSRRIDALSVVHCTGINSSPVCVQFIAQLQPVFSYSLRSTIVRGKCLTPIQTKMVNNTLVLKTQFIVRKHKYTISHDKHKHKKEFRKRKSVVECTFASIALQQVPGIWRKRSCATDQSTWWSTMNNRCFSFPLRI